MHKVNDRAQIYNPQKMLYDAEAKRRHAPALSRPCKKISPQAIPL